MSTTSLSELSVGSVIVAGQRKLSQRSISDFSARYAARTLPPIGPRRRPRRKELDSYANPWMICAIAEQLAAAAVAERLLVMGPILVEKVAWPDAVASGEEIKLSIQVLDACTSRPLESLLLRWRWLVTTSRDTQALDLISVTHLRLWQREAVASPTAASQRMAYKVTQASALVGVSKYGLYHAIRNQHLPAYRPRPGGDLLILAEDLRAWVMRHKASFNTQDTER